MKHKTGPTSPAGPGDRSHAEQNRRFDVIEFGCPKTGREGTNALATFKQSFPNRAVVADIDGHAGRKAAMEIFQAGADLLRVPGQASNPVIARYIEAAEAQHRGIVVDLSDVTDKVARAKEVLTLGAAFVEFLPGLFSRPFPPWPAPRLPLLR